MAVREGTRASKEFMCVSIAPDFCKSPNIVVPYSIISKFDCAVNFSTNVRFRKQWVFRHNSRLSTVLGDEAGSGGGVLSGVNKGFCRPIDGTSSKTVRANKSFVDYHEGTYMFMNCAGPDGQFNTIGRVIFLGNMLPGPVAPGAKVPKGCVEGSSSLLADIESKFGDLKDLIGKAKQLYALAKTDWSDPAAVLGAMGGLAGIAGLKDVAELAKKGKELYELGKKVANTDWNDPMQALSAVAGVANVAGMKDVAKAAGMATTVVNAIKTDWSDPRAALASATAIMKSTGLNQMVAEMASNAILDSNLPVSQAGIAPPLFPKPGSAGTDAGPGAGTKPATGKTGAPKGDASGAGKDGVLITTKQGNPSAAAAAIEAKARASNKKALEKAQAEERAKQEQAARERVAKQESDEGIADKDKTAEADNKLKTEDRPDDGGFVDAMKEGSDKVVKEGQKDLDTRNEQSAREADAKKSAAQNSADDLKATSDQLSRDAKASAVNAQHSSEVNEAIKLNAEANDAHKAAAIADAQAKSLPSGSELPKMELPDGLKALNKAASVLGPAGDVVQAGVGAYDAHNQFNAGQKHDAVVTIGKTGGALAGGASGAASGAMVGFAICGPPCAFIGAGVGAYGGDWLGGKAGGVVADIAADTAGIENQTPPAPD
jgi:hypothetical protein